MYVKVNNGVATPYSVSQLKKDNPSISFPANLSDAILAQFDMYPYTVSDAPDFDPSTHNRKQGAIEEVDGQWVQLWNIVPKTAEEVELFKASQKHTYESAVQNHLDKVAMQRGYDNIMSACSYAAASNKFQADGVAAIEWRSSVWDTAYNILADVEAGVRVTPTVEELISELPTINWPTI